MAKIGGCVPLICENLQDPFKVSVGMSLLSSRKGALEIESYIFVIF